MSEIMNQVAVPTHDVSTDLQRRLRGLRSGLQSDQQPEQAQLKKACEDFEAIFIGQLWKQMRASVPKDGMLHSKEEEQYLSMFDQELSLKMARSGGIGLSDMLFASLSERLAQASQDTESSRPLLPLKEKSQPLESVKEMKPPMKTMEALTVQQQVDMLAKSIERNLGGQDNPEPVTVAQSPQVDLDAAMRSVLIHDQDNI